MTSAKGHTILLPSPAHICP